MSVRLLPAVTEDVRPLFTLTGHTNIVHGMVLLPDGTLVSCSEDGTLRHWDIQRQRQLASLRPHGTCINGICLGHDGRYIVTAGDDSRVRWLEAGTFRELACGSAHTGYVSRVLCAPDGTVVTASADNSVGVWPCPPDVAALDIKAFIAAAAAAKAGASALVAPLTVQIVTSSGQIRTVKAPKPPKPPKLPKARVPKPTAFASGGSPGVVCSALKGHRGWVYALGLSPEGLLISASLNNQILAWDLRQRRPAGALYGADQGGTHAIMGDIYIAPSNTSGRGHSDAPHVLQFLPDGRLLSCAKEVIVWDPAGWTERVLDKGNGWQIHQAAVFDQGRKAAMVSYHSLRVLDLQTGAELAAAMPHDNDVYSVVITADEQTILCGDKSGKITAWSVDQLLRGGTPARHLGSCNSLIWSADGQRIATGGSDGTTRLWSADGALLQTFRHKDPNVNAVGLLSDAEGARAGGEALLFASHYGAFYAWETGTGALRFSGRPKGMTSYNPNDTWLTPDGQYVLTSAVLEGLAAWRILDGACEMFSGKTAYNQNLVWDTDGRTFYTSRYNDKAFGEIQKWELETRALVKGFGDPWAQLGRARPADKKEYANKLLLFPEIDRLVTGSSTGNVYGYDRDGTLQWEHQGDASFLVFHTIGRSVLAVYYKRADSGRWIDPLDGTSQPYPHPLPPFQRGAISPDGRWLAGTCDDTALIVIDVASGAHLAEIALPDKVYQLAFSPDSRVLALGMASGMLRFVEV